MECTAKRASKGTSEPGQLSTETRFMVDPLDTYLFDLRGYIHVQGALTTDEVDACNATLDDIPPLQPGQWHGHLHAHTYGTKDGLNYQQIYEAGEPFEKLIDHPAWIEKIKYFVGGEGTFDYHHGPLFIDENLANFRKPGEAIGLHSGGNCGIKRNQFQVFNGRFMCGQVNILLALTDIGPGDGGTMVVPGSHKSNFEHPHLSTYRMGKNSSGDGMEGAIEVEMKAGDALLFVDAMCHGSAKRANPGTRRIVVYRYGPSWGNFRYGYEPSPELLARLNPEARQIVRPLQLMPREPNRKN